MGHADKKERCIIRIGELRHNSVTPADAKKGGNIQGHRCDLKAKNILLLPVPKGSELQVLLENAGRCFPAADILMLVAAAQVGETPFFELFESHFRGIMKAGKKITGLVRQALPALEPERLGAQLQRPAMDKEHATVNPLHGHSFEHGKKGGIAQLLVPVRACRIAPAHEESVQEGMVMVPEN